MPSEKQSTSTPKSSQETAVTDKSVARGGIRPLKTYLTDVQTAIQEQKESMAKIALAERARREANKAKETPKKEVSQEQKKIFLIAGSVLGVIILVGGSWGAIRFFNIEFSLPGTGEPVIELRQNITAPSLVPPSHEKEIAVSGLTYDGLIAAVRQEISQDRAARSIENIFFTKTVEPVAGVSVGKEVVSAQEFFSQFFGGTPETLTRALAQPFMLGVYYDAFKIGYPFIILKTNSFETSFAGMLAWEKTLVAELGPLFGVATWDTQGFLDIVIQNKDTRALVDRFRDPVLIYSFIDRNTILIAPDKDTFGSVLPLIK